MYNVDDEYKHLGTIINNRFEVKPSLCGHMQEVPTARTLFTVAAFR